MMNWFNALSASAKRTLNAATSDVVLVFDGDSWIQSNQGSGIDQYFPKEVQSHFNSIFNSLDFYSFGVGGQSTLDMIADAPTQIHPLVDENKVNILVAGEDLNAIIGDGRTAQENYDDIISYFQSAKDAGFDYCISWNSAHIRKVSGVYPSPNTDPSWEPVIESYYNMISGANLYQLPIDYHLDLRIAPNIGGAQGQEIDYNYWFDSVHPNQTGYDIIAGLMIDEINKIFRL